MIPANFINLLKTCGLSPRKTSSGWEARCTGHDDHNASLSIAEGKDGRILLKCFAGCPVESIVSALGLKMSDLFPARAKEHHHHQRGIVALYDYQDEGGKLIFQCVRYETKKFKQRRPDPQKPGAWIWDLKDTRRVLYRLPEVLAAVAAGRTIFIAEGEKDCDALAQAGFVATCNPMGAGKWLPEHTSMLQGAARVVVIPDKDEAGGKHGEQVARSLHGKAKSVRVIKLPDRADNRVKDAADFFAAGGTADELSAIVKAAQDYRPLGEPLTTEKGSTASEYLADDPEKSEDPKPVRPSVATQLVRMVEHFEFFHDQQSRAFARMEVNGHVEVWPVNSTQFRNLLAQTYYRHTRKAANRNALADAVATLHGRALFDGEEAPVFLRVAPHCEDILIDLCDPKWRVIRVTPGGWEVLDKSPVAFIRTAAMRPLPMPVPASEGSLNPLWKLLNVTKSQRPLIAGALLNGFHPHGPYFVINYVGEQGSAKSCAARIHRQLIDPNATPLRSPPRDDRDLLVQGASNWCVTLDNLSRLSP